MVICAHLIGPFFVWCFCPSDDLVSKICLYSYHTVFPDKFLCVGVLQIFCCPVVFGPAAKLGC